MLGDSSEKNSTPRRAILEGVPPAHLVHDRLARADRGVVVLEREVFGDEPVQHSPVDDGRDRLHDERKLAKLLDELRRNFAVGEEVDSPKREVHLRNVHD